MNIEWSPATQRASEEFHEVLPKAATLAPATAEKLFVLGKDASNVRSSRFFHHINKMGCPCKLRLVCFGSKQILQPNSNETRHPLDIQKFNPQIHSNVRFVLSPQFSLSEKITSMPCPR